MVRLLILVGLLLGPRAHAQSRVEREGPVDAVTVKVADGTAVTLVGFASDRSVTASTQKAKAGVARFAKLDTSGKTAYFALAQRSRKAGIDRLLSMPVVPAPGVGATVVMDEPKDAIDELEERNTGAGSAPVKGKVRIAVQGATEAGTAIEIIDAVTRKVVAKGKTEHALELDLKAKPGQVFYAEAVTKQDRYRSTPFQVVADRGAAVTVYIYPRLLPSFALGVYADDSAVVVNGSYTVTNYSWIPYAADDGQGPALPLPRGATAVAIQSDDPGIATITNGEVKLARPLAPGELEIPLYFELAASKGRVEWSLDLPHGTFKSSLAIEQEPGLFVLDAPTGADSLEQGGVKYHVFQDVSITPRKSMTFTIKLPPASEANAVRHACRRMQPEPGSPLVGKALAFTLPTVDGKTMSFAKLRGTGAALVLMTAPWVGHAKGEPGKLATLAKTKGLATIVVVSGSDAKEARADLGPLAIPMVLDAPKKAGGDSTDPEAIVGAVTFALGISKLPESVLVDRKGIIRYHFVNVREWDTPQAARCAKAFAAQK